MGGAEIHIYIRFLMHVHIRYLIGYVYVPIETIDETAQTEITVNIVNIEPIFTANIVQYLKKGLYFIITGINFNFVAIMTIGPRQPVLITDVDRILDQY